MKTVSLALLLAFIFAGHSGLAKMNASWAFYPTGYMGDWGDIEMDEAADDPYSAPNCIKITYKAVQSEGKGFAGICWQYPADNIGEMPGRIDLANHSMVTFWARGALGGEKAEFMVGGGPSDSIQPAATSGVVSLSRDWQQFTINLAGMNLSNVVNGFCWRATKVDNPYGSTIYLDDIFYE